MFHDFRRRLRSKELLIGSMVTLNSPSSAEILASVGFDWLFIDAEHGPYDTCDLMTVLQAVDHRVPCVVRVASSDESVIKRTLDLGAAGIIVPQVNSRAQAEAVVESARYAPRGRRGVGLARAQGYGYAFAEYLEAANESVAVIVQAEHRDAVEQIDSITDVDGIDAVLVGPYDLSASYDKMGQVEDEEVVRAIERVTTTCQQKSIPLGMFGITADVLLKYIDLDYSLIVGSVDSLFLMEGARGMLERLRDHK